jgi:hypothetical protein
MRGTSHERQSPGARRDKRLAEALRANLKRRKAPPRNAAVNPDKAIEKPETDVP